MKHPGFISASAIFAVAVLSIGEVVTAQPDDLELTVRGGAIVFDNPEFGSQTLLEFPFVLSRDEFEFFRPDSADSNWYARIFAQVRLLKYDGMAVDSSNVYFSARVASLDEAAILGIRLFNNVSLLVDPGVYTARLTIIDVVSKRKSTVFYERIVMEPPAKDRLRIGGTALAYDISFVGSQTTAGDRLVKNGFKVLVNPLRVYSSTAKSLYFYGELYNLNYGDSSASRYRVSYAILDGLKKLVQEYGFKSKVKPGPSAVIVEELDIAGWNEGDYTLRVVAYDESSGDSDTARLAFKIITPGSGYYKSTLIRELDPYDTLTIDVKVHLVKYLLSPPESQTLRNLNDESKDRFLTQFWGERDPDQSTRLNEFRAEQIKRYEFSNGRFSSNTKRDNGWSTDRGRIYMIYGPWERRKYVDLPQKTDPFEVWFYYSHKEGAVFVFEDREAFFDKTLIHSNVNGERYNARWNEILKDLDLLEDF